MVTSQRSDEDIKKEVVDHLYWDNEVDASDIEVRVTDGEITLTGVVPSVNSRMAAEDTVFDIGGVFQVDNKLDVETSELKESLTDPKIESRINETLIWDSEIDATDIELEVDNGFVTVGGNVDKNWKKIRIEHKITDLVGVVNVTSEISVVPTEDVMDESIAEDIERAFERNVYINPDNITLNVENGDVTITGSVYSNRAKSQIYDVVIRTEGVKTVSNDVMVESKSASII